MAPTKKLPLCGAKKKQGPGTCTKVAGFGTDHVGTGHCKWHGGSSPGGIEYAAKQQMAIMGAPVDDLQPHEALIFCVRLTAGEVRYCQMKILELSDVDAVVRPETEKTEDYETEDGRMGTHTSTTVHKEELNLWVKVRIGAVERLARYSKMALDAGVEERRIQLAENWAEDTARLLKGILGDLKLTPKQKERAPEIIQKHLLALETSSTMKMSLAA